MFRFHERGIDQDMNAPACFQKSRCSLSNDLTSDGDGFGQVVFAIDIEHDKRFLARGFVQLRHRFRMRIQILMITL